MTPPTQRGSAAADKPREEYHKLVLCQVNFAQCTSNPPENEIPCLIAKVLSRGLRDTPQSSLGKLLEHQFSNREESFIYREREVWGAQGVWGE